MTATAIVASAKKQGRKLLTEIEAKQVLGEIGVDTTLPELATSRDEALALAKKIGYPVVLKISSQDVVHKSDAGGVKVNLRTAAQVGKAYDSIIASVKEKFPTARIEGISVQKMAKPGTEIIIGMFKDAQFGPVLMFGLGGIFVEILKDVSYRIVPLAPRDAREMIREIKGFPLLNGYRGQDPADVAYLESLLLKVSEFAEKNPSIKEMDINPIFAYKKGAVAVDARIILEDEVQPQ